MHNEPFLAISSEPQIAPLTSAPPPRSVPYLLGYVGFALASAILVVVRSITTLTIGLNAGRKLHNNLLSAVVRAPMAFFDVTPLGRQEPSLQDAIGCSISLAHLALWGRLINAFSSESQTVDVSLPAALQTYGTTACAVLSTLAVVIANSPGFLIFLVPIAYAYVAAQNFYIRWPTASTQAWALLPIRFTVHRAQLLA